MAAEPGNLPAGFTDEQSTGCRILGKRPAELHESVEAAAGDLEWNLRHREDGLGGE